MQSNLRASSVFYNVVGGSQNLDCSPGRRGGTAGINVHTPLGSVPSFVVRHSRARVASAEPRGSRARRVVTARRSRVARWRVPVDASMVAEPPDGTTMTAPPRSSAPRGARRPRSRRPGSDRDAASSSSFVDASAGTSGCTRCSSSDRRAGAPLTAIQHLLNRELGLEDHPETINRFFAVEFAVSAQPAYAAVSDLCPIRGRRRPVHGPRRRGIRRRCNSSRACGRRRSSRRRRLRRRVLRHVRVRRGRRPRVRLSNERDALAREDHLENHRSARAMRAQALGMTVRSAGASSRRRRASPSSPSSTREPPSPPPARSPSSPRSPPPGSTTNPLARSRPARRGIGRRMRASGRRLDHADRWIRTAGDERIVLRRQASASAFFSGASVAANVASTARRVTPGQRGAAAFVFAYRLPRPPS